MDKHELYIDFPDENTIQLEIDKIIEKGVKPKETFYCYLRNMYTNVGIRHLFHDLTEIVFTVLVIAAVLSFIILGLEIQRSIDNGSIYSFIFIVSPILYLAVSSIAFINTKYKGTYELEMSCKYNIYQLAALRMLLFSIFSILVNCAALCLLAIYFKHISLPQAIMLSITSLFLFSSIFLYMIFKIKSTFTKGIVIFLWITANLAAAVYSLNLYRAFLIKIPVLVYLVVIAAFIYIYIRNLKKLITFKNIEGVI